MPNIIIEDGTTVDNANSYVDLDYLDLYADDRGLALPTSNDDREIFLIIAFDYLQYRLDTYQCEFTEIPDKLKKAQCQLVVEQQKRTLLWPKPITSSVEGFVTEKTVGPLTKKFAPISGGRAMVGEPIIIASVELFLKPVLNSDSCAGAGCNWKKTIRA